MHSTLETKVKGDVREVRRFYFARDRWERHVRRC